jgi:hypothetical protein
VHGANERAAATADHAHAEFAIQFHGRKRENANQR